jgi:hypothetical protein
MEINQEQDQEQFIETTIVEDNFSPLDAPVKKRSYTNHVLATDDAVVEDLAEPTFQRPNFSDFEPEEEAGKKEPDRPFNESYSELDNKEKTMGAEMMAEMTLDLYAKGCGWLGKVPEINEKKLDGLIAEGEIDGNIQIPTESGNVSVRDFAQEYNSSIKDAFEVSDEFKENVKAPLIRVLKKRGIGMTDEQLLGYYFVKDFGTKVAQVVMLKKTSNNILDSLKENTQALRESQVQRPAPAPVQQVVKEEPIKYYAEEEEVVIKKPKRQKTNLEEQIEFFEPEEAGSVFNNLKDNGGFSQDFQEADNMPKFGDAEILSQLEKLSGEPTKPVRKSTTGAKRGRKPKAK